MGRLPAKLWAVEVMTEINHRESAPLQKSLPGDRASVSAMANHVSRKIARKRLSVVSKPFNISKHFPNLGAANLSPGGFLVAGHNHDLLLTP